MVTDTEGYIYIIEYLTEHLSLFEKSVSVDEEADTVISNIEMEFSEQIISICGQNLNLNSNQRNAIIREVDSIVGDLEEILSGVINNPITEEQSQFIKELAALIKNIFDSEISTLLTDNS